MSAICSVDPASAVRLANSWSWRDRISIVCDSMFWVAVVSGSSRPVSLSAGEILAALAIASLNRAMRVMNPSSSPGSMNRGPAPPDSRPITSSIDQPTSTASLRAAMAAWSDFGALDQV